MGQKSNGFVEHFGILNVERAGDKSARAIKRNGGETSRAGSPVHRGKRRAGPGAPFANAKQYYRRNGFEFCLAPQGLNEWCEGYEKHYRAQHPVCLETKGGGSAMEALHAQLNPAGIAHVGRPSPACRPSRNPCACYNTITSEVPAVAFPSLPSVTDISSISLE